MSNKFLTALKLGVAAVTMLFGIGIGTITGKAAFEAPYYNININGGSFDGTNYVLGDGTVVKNAFFCDGTYTYFLQADGTPMKDKLTYHPDGEHVIYFDANGYEAFDEECYIAESISGERVRDYCYFGAEGYMVKDEIVFHQNQPVYYNLNGVKQRKGQFSFADGNLGVADVDGDLIYNTFGYDAKGQVVFFHWNGTIAKGLICDGNYFYDMDLTDGHLKGWFSADGIADSSVFPGSFKSEYYNDMMRINYSSDDNIDTEWRCCINVQDYMNKKYGKKDDWSFEIYRDEAGIVVDSELKQIGNYSTSEGIKIGSKREDVFRAYEDKINMFGRFNANIHTMDVDSQPSGNHDLINFIQNNQVDLVIVSAGRTNENLGYCVFDFYRYYGILFFYDEKGDVEKIRYFHYKSSNHGMKMECIFIHKSDFPEVLDASVSKFNTDNSTYQWYDILIGAYADFKILEGETDVKYTPPSDNKWVCCEITDLTTNTVSKICFIGTPDQSSDEE